MIANTGTDIDGPLHRYSEGADLAHLPLISSVHLVGIVIRLRGNSDRRIPEKCFPELMLKEKQS